VVAGCLRLLAACLGLMPSATEHSQRASADDEKIMVIAHEVRIQSFDRHAHLAIGQQSHS
jgi:hypothetical protein